MNITPSATGYEHLMVFIALQGVKEGIIKSEYSGSMRLADYVAEEAFIKKCIAAWLEYAVETFRPLQTSEIVVDFPVIQAGDADAIFADMLAKGYLSYDDQHSVYVFTSLNTIFGYVLTSEANVQDWGVIAWGCDGLGATYASSDLPGVVIDPGVTEAEYLAQFPQHGVTGSDVMLTYSGANALPRLLNGWDPRLKDLVSAIRAHIPAPIPTP